MANLPATKKPQIAGPRILSALKNYHIPPFSSGKLGTSITQKCTRNVNVETTFIPSFQHSVLAIPNTDSQGGAATQVLSAFIGFNT